MLNNEGFRVDGIFKDSNVNASTFFVVVFVSWRMRAYLRGCLVEGILLRQFNECIGLNDGIPFFIFRSLFLSLLCVVFLKCFC